MHEDVASARLGRERGERPDASQRRGKAGKVPPRAGELKDICSLGEEVAELRGLSELIKKICVVDLGKFGIRWLRQDL